MRALSLRRTSGWQSVLMCFALLRKNLVCVLFGRNAQGSVVGKLGEPIEESCIGSSGR